MNWSSTLQRLCGPALLSMALQATAAAFTVLPLGAQNTRPQIITPARFTDIALAYRAGADKFIVKDPYESEAAYQERMGHLGSNEQLASYYRQSGGRNYSLAIPVKLDFDPDRERLWVGACFDSTLNETHRPQALSVLAMDILVEGRSEVCFRPSMPLGTFPAAYESAPASFSFTADQARSFDVLRAPAQMNFLIRMTSDQDHRPAYAVHGLRLTVGGRVLWTWDGEPPSTPLLRASCGPVPDDNPWPCEHDR